MTDTAFKSPHLVLGTAQLGLGYGVANQTGMPSESEAITLLHTAIRAGIDHIDTARAYGDSERRIGLALADPALLPVTIVTKLDPLAALRENGSEEDTLAAVTASLAASRQALGRDRLDTVLLHRAAHRTQWGGVVWRTLLGERDAGRIDAVGVSVQSPSEGLAALDDRQVGHIQLPFNLLDRRWHDAGVIDVLRHRPDITVHVRSVFLQGLLTGNAIRWPAVPGVEFAVVLQQLKVLAASLGRSGLTDLCLAYVRGQAWIDGIVIGVETVDQVKANLALFERAPLRAADIAATCAALPALPDTFLDPARWP